MGQKKKLFAAVFLLVGASLLFSNRIQQESARELFEKAIYLEETKGELEEAIAIFERVVKDYPGEQAVAANAQLHIGLCFEKLGKAEAIKAYELVVKNYAGQADQVAIARARLAALKKEEPAGLSVTEIIIEGELFVAYALSRDGTKIAGNVYTKGQNLAAYDLTTKKLNLVTGFTYQTKEESGRWAMYPVWSPDGNEIAYLSGGWQMTVPQELRVSTLDGKSRVLYQMEKGSIVPFDWLPDGSAVLAVKVHLDETPSELGLVPREGGTFNPIHTSDKGIFTSHFSPDNRYIVFEAGPKDGTGDIYIVGADGKSLEVLTDNPAADKQPLWSPDGKHIVFLSDRHGDWALWGIAVKEGKPDGHPFMIKTDMADSNLCTWAPSGLLYTSMYLTKDIFVLAIDPETLEPEGKSLQIPFAPTGGNWCPVWSPDGKYLAFASRTKGAGGATSIVLLSASGGEARQFQIPKNYSTDVIGDLRWLPDSSGIGYSGFDEKGNPSLFRLTFANEEWKAFSIPIEWWTSIEWNFDGSAFIYTKHSFNSDEPGIIEHNLGTGQERYIYTADNSSRGAIRGLKFSQDRKWLTFRKTHTTEEKSSIMVLEIETGKVHTASDRGFSYPAWSPDAGKILVRGRSGSRSRPRELFVLPASGGAEKRIDIGSLPKGAELRRLDWSPDGRRIAYTLLTGQLTTRLMKNPIPNQDQ